jgi:hypothetical protein
MGVETAIALAGLGISAYQGFKGAQAESAANEAAAQAASDAKRISEQDKFASLKVPTLGAELAQQNIQAQQASTLRALQESGAAGVLGGLTGLGQQSQAQNLQLAAQADQMQYQRDAALAQNAQQIEQGRMQREFAMNQSKLAGAQSAAAEGRQQQNMAIQGGLSALSNAASLKAYTDVNTPQPPMIINEKLNGKGQVPVSSNIQPASNAFAAQITSMRPQNIQINNPALNQIKGNSLSSIPGSGVQVLTPMDWMSAPNSPYNWMYGNVTTGK